MLYKIWGAIFFGSKKYKRALLSILALCLLSLIYRAYGISFFHFFIFICLLLVLVVFPGRVILDWLNIKATQIQDTSLILSLGFVSIIILAKFTRWLKIEFLLFLWLIFCLVWFLRTLFRRSRQPVPTDFSRPFLIGISIIFFALFLVLLLDNFLNGQILSSDDIALRMRFYDGFLRIAVIHELTHSLPPQLPFASENPLSYHYGMDLFFSLFCRYGQLDVFDVSHRLGLTFLVFLFFLNVILFLKNHNYSDSLVLFGTFYLLFGSGGLAYLFSWLFKAPFTGNIFFNFYFHDFISLNSFLPCMAIFFAGLTALHNYEKEGKKGYLIAASLFLAALFEFKVFIIIPVAVGLLLSTMAQMIFHKKKLLIPVTILTGFFCLPLFLTAFLYGQKAMGYRFSLKPIDWLQHILRELHLSRWQEAWSMLISGNLRELSSLMVGLAAIAIFLLGAFGLNLIGLPGAIKSLFDRSSVKSFLAWFFLISMANFFLVNLYLGRLTRNILNIYVFYAGLICLSIFFLQKLEEKLVSRKPLQKGIILSLLSLLVLPNTAIYFTSRIKQPDIRLYSKDFIEAATWVKKKTPPEATFIHPSNMRYICYFAGRRVVLDTSIHSYLDFHLPRPKIRERLGDLDRFFYDPQKNVDVLFKYNVSYVWVYIPISLGPYQVNQRAGEEIVLSPPPSFPNPALKVKLKPVFKNREHLIYEVGIE